MAPLKLLEEVLLFHVALEFRPCIVQFHKYHFCYVLVRCSHLLKKIYLIIQSEMAFYYAGNTAILICFCFMVETVRELNANKPC